MNNFYSDLSAGKRAEMLVSKALTAKGHKVEDVSNDIEYQLLDIDFLISKNGNSTTLEVKNDIVSCRTGNVFIEVKNNNNVSRNGDGWYLYCQAQYLCFVQEQLGIAHIVSRAAIEKHLSEKYYPYRFSCDTCGYCIPIEVLKTFKGYCKLYLNDDTMNITKNRFELEKLSTEELNILKDDAESRNDEFEKYVYLKEILNRN